MVMTPHGFSRHNFTLILFAREPTRKLHPLLRHPSWPPGPAISTALQTSMPVKTAVCLPSTRRHVPAARYRLYHICLYGWLSVAGRRLTPVGRFRTVAVSMTSVYERDVRWKMRCHLKIVLWQSRLSRCASARDFFARLDKVLADHAHPNIVCTCSVLEIAARRPHQAQAQTATTKAARQP